METVITICALARISYVAHYLIIYANMNIQERHCLLSLSQMPEDGPVLNFQFSLKTLCKIERLLVNGLSSDFRITSELSCLDSVICLMAHNCHSKT